MAGGGFHNMLRRWCQPLGASEASRADLRSPVGRRRLRHTGLHLERLEPRAMLAGVVINEFVAQNTSGIFDEDGERSDWIELVNTDAAAIDLDGWYLTDDPTNLTKWQLPATNLAAGGYEVVFASGKDRHTAGEELHTNFGLDVAGESLLLVMPDGVTIADAYDPYPEQSANVSYGRASIELISELLIDEEANVRVLIPTDNSVDSTWFQPGFDDSSWTAGETGVGYETSAAGSYDPYISLDVGAEMYQLTSTAYLRVPFTVTNPDELVSLLLEMRYDDGFAVYLNGTEIAPARRNTPPGVPNYQWGASSGHGDSLAVQYEPIDISAHLDLLQSGANVLAIHGLNQSDGSSDFLISPLLSAERTVVTSIGYMVTPTPGAANSLGTLGFVEDTKFSVDRGFYDAPFTVEITTDTADAQIRYTLDGDEPTATTGIVYEPLSPPLITTTTTLRAAAFKTGFTPTNVDTQTYLFLADVIEQDGSGLPPHADWGWLGPDWELDPDVVNNPLYANTIIDDLQSVATVSLVMPWDDWFGDNGQGIYIDGKGVERSGSIELFTADGSEEFQIDAALEIQGGSSTNRWKMDKLSIEATFKAPYGPTKLEADLFNNPLFDENATDEFDRLIFDAQLNYVWAYGGSSSAVDQRARAKQIQDQYMSDLQNFAGGQAPHGRFVHLYINGLYWGMYGIHERPDESFAEAYLGGDKDDYDVIKHTATTVVESIPIDPGIGTGSGDSAIENYAAMLNLVRQDMSVLANYQVAAEKIDVDGLISYMIINYYGGNDDWAHHNWYATFNRVEPDAQWRFHSWDAEHVLKNVAYNAISTGGVTGSPEEVHLQLMGNEEYQVRFFDQVQRLFFNGGLLTPESAAEIYMARMQEVDRAIVGESARWGDNHTVPFQEPEYYTREHWVATQNDLLNNYFPIRSGIVLEQFDNQGWLATLDAPLFSNYGDTVESGFELSLSLPGGTPSGADLVYTLDGSDPRAPGGATSPSAISYAGPIVIDAATQVRARIFRDATAAWSPIIDATFLLETPYPLRITELNYHPADAEEHEFIELMNTGSESISLDGVQIADFASEPYEFVAGLTLAAGQRIVVARNPGDFQTEYGTHINLAPTGYAGANLSNGGETVTLHGPFGELLQSIMYSDDAPWPTAADGSGSTLEILDALGDASDPANWRASLFDGGSPGTSGDLLPGDYNGDGIVAAADYVVWRNTQDQQVTAYEGADGDGSGVIDAADYQVWRANYGRTMPLPAVGAVSASTAASANETESGDAPLSLAGVSTGSLTETTTPTSSRSEPLIKSESVQDRNVVFTGIRRGARSFPNFAAQTRTEPSPGVSPPAGEVSSTVQPSLLLWTAPRLQNPSDGEGSERRFSVHRDGEADGAIRDAVFGNFDSALENWP